VIGALLEMVALQVVVMAWPTMGWRCTDGVVERTSVSEADDDYRVTSWELRVTYAYTVNGIGYRSSRFACKATAEWNTRGRVFPTRERALAAAARYPAGAPLTVFYDRRRPEMAVRKRTTIGRRTKYCALAGLVFLLLACVACLPELYARYHPALPGPDF
jgi:hypothetical protein